VNVSPILVKIVEKKNNIFYLVEFIFNLIMVEYFTLSKLVDFDCKKMKNSIKC